MSETNNIDDRLVSWLYGELDEGEAARFEDEMGRDVELAAEAESLRHTREMVSQLEDEEPPAALSSFLIHAAAKEVSKAPAGMASDDTPGLWATFLAGYRALGARPTLAAAAALVAIVGVAGVLVSRDGLDMAQESAKSDTVAVRAPAATAEKPKAVVVGDEAKEEEADADEGAAPAPADEPVAVAEPEPAEGQRVGRLVTDERRQLESKKDSNRRSGARQVKQQAKLDYKRKKTKAKPKALSRTSRKSAPSRDKSGYAFESSNAVSGADQLQKNEAPSVGPSGGVLGSAGKPGAARPYAQSQALNDKWAEGQMGKLSAKKIKCSRVAQIANDILDRNPKFYYRRVRGSKKVSACNWYVSRETTRRSRLRGKKGAGSGDSAVAAPRKRRAAPAKAPDDAYEAAETAK
jgi:hypothetical protein